jgi:hypothetical protein
MALAAVNSREFESCFSLHKQSAIATAIAAASIDKKLPYRSFAPALPEFPGAMSDDGWYGRGSNFPSFWDPHQKLIRIPARNYPMTNLAAMFGVAFVMGAVATTQPNSAAHASVYDHAFTFQDAETNMECVYTSMIEKFGAVQQRLIHGVVLERFEITGDGSDYITLTWQGFGRNWASDATSLPAVATGTTFFNFRRATFTFGASTGPAVISPSVTGFTFQGMQNPNARRNAGASAGEEKLVSKVLLGKQRVSGSITLDQMDSDTLALFENNTECSLSIVCIGDMIGSTGYYHQVTISIPHYKLPSISLGEDGDLATLTLPFNEATVLKASGSDYASVTIRTNIDGTEILQVAA